MPPVFAHGRLRLYLLKLLDEAPRHGYEVIRLLEERFQGLYAPSAGTVYPRLAKLEAEGLVTHTSEGGRKTYAITDAGRTELADRGGELAELELEIRESVAALASDIREDVRGSAQDLRREVDEAARRTRSRGGPERGFPDPAAYFGGGFQDKESWRQAKEDFRRAKEEWKEQARRAKAESRRAREDAQQARRQARAAQDAVREQWQQAFRRVTAQAQEHAQTGDWAGAVRDALSEVSREMGRFTSGWEAGPQDPGSAGQPGATASGPAAGPEPGPGRPGPDLSKPTAPSEAHPEAPLPAWAEDHGATGAPDREFDRLLDRFRDDLRDAARDHGVTAEQLRTARARLGRTAADLGSLLRGE
ncbi:helix-turn-helix transcriptional regulator [Streptomyces sp. NPDC059740]|uniref:helix-turn-helix transcriptional regulator n=1 Tax=Streptomyces sp. NPDC059740 TaxID=3346926 RepID=UPI003658462B